jgi:predicted secreted protein
MTLAKTMNGSKLLIKLGDGGSPETFTAYCVINSNREINFGSSPIKSLIPDCDNLDAPAWEETLIEGLNAAITGAGMLDTASLDTFRTWFFSGAAKNLQVWNAVAQADGGGYYSGAAVLTSFQETGPERRQKVTFQCTINSTGPWTWTASGP